MLGVYNSDFIVNALSLYSKYKDSVGNIFTLYPLIVDETSGLVYKVDNMAITFDINDHEKYVVGVEKMKIIDGFIALSLITDKHFISHYFQLDTLSKFMKNIFTMEHVTVSTTSLGKRYIMVHIEKVVDDGHWSIVTMLNNVLGNIP